jgi:hypothetical protein
LDISERVAAIIWPGDFARELALPSLRDFTHALFEAVGVVVEPG